MRLPMTRATYRPPGVYLDLSLEQYLAITDKVGWPAVSNTLLRSVRHGPRECQHRQRFGIGPTESMLAGSLAHIQILDPRRYLDRIVEWKEPQLEPRPALKWDKISKEHYATSCGRYQLERTLGGDWRAACTEEDDMSGAGDAIVGTLGGVVAAKAACKEHYERTVPRNPKLDGDGNPKLAPQNKNSHTYQAFVAANPGREIVTRPDIEQAQRISDAVRDNPEARRRIGDAWRTEYTIVWEHAETGALMKCRHDWLTDPGRHTIDGGSYRSYTPGPRAVRSNLVTLGELKTCRSAEESAFNRQAADMEYHAQAAHYRAGFRAHFGRDIETESICLAVENGGSHDSTVYTWDPSPGRELDAGHELNEERLQTLLGWRDEYGTGQWPGRRDAAHLDFGAHGRGDLLGGDDHGLGGPKVDFGVIPK